MLNWRRSGRILLQNGRVMYCPIDTDDQGNPLNHCPCCVSYVIITKCQQNGTLPPGYKPFQNLWIVCYSSTLGMFYWQQTDQWLQFGKFYEDLQGTFHIVPFGNIQSFVGDEETPSEYYPTYFRTEEYAQKVLDNVDVEKLKQIMQEVCKCIPQIVATGTSWQEKLQDGSTVQHPWILPDFSGQFFQGHRWKIVETSYGNNVANRGNISSKGQLLGLPSQKNLWGKGYTSHWALMTGCEDEDGYIQWPSGYEDEQSNPGKE